MIKNESVDAAPLHGIVMPYWIDESVVCESWTAHLMRKTECLLFWDMSYPKSVANSGDYQKLVAPTGDRRGQK